MTGFPSHTLRLIRPIQWIKNFFVFIPFALSLQVKSPDALQTIMLTLVVFCITSSAIYVWNDIMDRERDREHPEKCKRPIASGAISIRQAVLLGTVLIIVGLSGAYALHIQLFQTIIAYIVLNIFYTLILKHVAFLELVSLAGNYVLRIIGGTVVIGEEVTYWVILLATLLALFLAIGKRHSEYEKLAGRNTDQRSVLRYYNKKLLDSLLVLSAGVTMVAWLLYTTEPSIQERLQTTLLPISTVFVVCGISRYYHLVKKHIRGESPATTFLADPPLIITVGLWMTFIVWFRLFS